ncbi:PAP/fibrillin family protein [Chroococcus sp. FPU101]|uniref:PAP/fibrillin family protein n=1 Tax=Chroococcus sp. FPU101 TaxID=1974212 RepID=UPI001A8CD981|nr:PAP/fibrillin family protein [Chroococcus sp. FPU101]GFE71234.1 PAP fibrillin family protein [Chroococcus sp. FPU101]
MKEKAKLLEIIAGRNRGLLSSEADKVRVLTAVEQLEDHNPTPNPVLAIDLLDGDWRLLYTTSRGILGLDNIPLLQLGQIYQCIRVNEAKLYNIAEIVGVPFLEGIVSVAAQFEPVSDRRVNVKFERSIIGLQRLIGYRTPSQLIQDIESGKKFLPVDFSIQNRDQQGWLEITYLDQDLRIGRGNEGNIFILAKEKS